MPSRIRKPWFWPLLALLFFFLSCVPVDAKHLVGGSVSYKYLGRSGPNLKYYKYRVSITVYRDATGGGPDFDDPVTIGVYDNAGSKPLLFTTSINLGSQRLIKPVSGGSPCSNTPESEMYETVYTTEIELEASAYGYRILWQRCCRNSQVNLPDNEGQTYEALIPPTNTLNTSPSFSEVPVPYICSSDTTTLVNTASEPDGDSLVYELAHPYAGGNDQAPTPPIPDFFPDPLPLVNYRSGYSFGQPFGTNGYASIDKFTGATEIYAVAPGSQKFYRYALAIDVKEYRKGKLINITRRDIQIIVITTCKPSNAPVRQPVNGVIQNSFEVTAGDTLSIPMLFTADDTLFASASGEIFDASSINPVGTFNKTVGRYSLDPTITWNTDCSHARSQPYIVNVKVWNNGCPPKSINATLTITVKPFKAVSPIIGRSPACIDYPGEIYSYKKVNKNSKLIWQVKNGTIQSYPSAEEVLVVWKPGSTAEIKVIEISNDGCLTDTVKKSIVLNPRPSTSPVLGEKIACVNAVKKYTVLNTPGSQYYWFITGGTITSGGTSNQVEVMWTIAGKGEVKVLEMDKNGCRGDTMRLPITIGTPSIYKVYGSTSVCPNATAIDYWVDPQAGSSYIWSIIGGTQASGGNTDHITVNWGAKGGGVVKVVERTKDGCVSDTVRLNVTKDYVLYTPSPSGDTSVCAFEKGVAYSVVYSNGSTYNWSVVGGTIVSGNGSSSVVVDWNDEGTGYIGVTETAFDPINGKPCIGMYVVTKVRINPLPKTSQIFGPTEFCQGDQPLWFVKGFETSVYKWAISNGKWTSEISMPVGVGEDTTTWPSWAKDSIGTFTLMVWEQTKDTCGGSPRILKVIVHPLPVPKPLSGPKTVCLPELKGHKYSFDQDPANTVEWEIDGGSIVGGLGTKEITVDWELAGVRQIRVREKSSFGCLGPWNRMDVNVDSLAIEIDYVTTQRGNDQIIEVHFHVKNAQFLKKKVRIYRGRSTQDGYTLIDSINASSTLFLDRKAETRRNSYYYYLAAENMCGVTITSPRHRSILAQGGFEGDTTMLLHWNPYEGWPGGVDYYHVYQSMNDDTTLTFHSMVKTDSLERLIDNMEGWKQCFRVAAVKAQDNSIVSWSNKVCYDFEPIVWIPNVFTPDNGDFVNNTFRISVIHHRSFSVTIYNRWGERVFESDDPRKQWDGSYRGKQVPEGIYVYMVTVKGTTTRIYKQGTVQVMR
jgi:gliding motility-associated-like protein